MSSMTKQLLLFALAGVLVSCGGSILDEGKDAVSTEQEHMDCTGLTPGFWGNKHGIAMISADDLAYLNGFDLVDRKGNLAADFANAQAVAAFERSSSASVMANMLSVQWVAFALNYRHDLLCAGLDVTFWVDETGPITFEDVEAAVVAALGTEATREQQELLKEYLDGANNGEALCECAPPTGATGGYSTGGFSN